MRTLVLAVSARKLAAAARRAGADILVADFFGDVDTRSLARWHPLPGSLEGGIDGEALLEWVRRLDEGLGGIVYGAGFERDPSLLDALAAIAPLIGNRADVVAAVKDPFAFAALLGRLGLPHPDVATSPRPGGRWLRKRRGGSGGTHIEPATARSPSADASHYFQTCAPGQSISALFTANGRASRVLGFSAQWTAPAPARPFRFGGCAGPAPLAPALACEIERACEAITAATGLVGLNSLDTLVTGETYTILEVNPRPGATLDLFDDAAAPSLWRCHVDGVRGKLPAPRDTHETPPHAAMVIYADRARDIPASFDWGAGVADIPTPGSHIAAGMPICTVVAAGPDIESARTETEHRARALLHRLPLHLRESA
jgi:predicted ATP-grasp superfamily ATP-dependent carboligase